MAKLILVGLPLGNIEDISLRVLQSLFNANYIAAEDTRNYLKIKSIIKERYSNVFTDINFENKPELISYREQNHENASKKIIEIIKSGIDVHLMSDAGMPAISDPGYRLVEECLTNEIEIDVLPSATALDTALVLSGLPTDKFCFLGFLPRQESKIIKNIEAAKDFTIIFYESPYRVRKTLEVIYKKYPQAKVALCNDLTKKFQKVIRGTVSEALTELGKKEIKGEWAIVLRVESER
jgi:16S rRNA (cytidine1402-2'-O)-methyltransferase